MMYRLWVQINILDGNGAKAMPESIFNTQFWFKMIIKKKNIGSQMGHTDKKYLKKKKRVTHARKWAQALIFR
jgi:hypothetical protein